ncbi:hypothetical protein HNY73_002947 [Argiope bruennichi]|uniref:Uncharacterized protein n=1 Tax=Argiope bruennichi TaxID=94029 RepID=A0A8T0FZI1_ARGBR|nr:hypothetical protein HNY73_002947 [Argiope bruennichi]
MPITKATHLMAVLKKCAWNKMARERQTYNTEIMGLIAYQKKCAFTLLNKLKQNDQCDISEGPAAKQFGNCITNNLTPKDLNDTYQSAIKTYGNYNSDTFDGAVKEMCNQNDEKRRETYKNEMNGFFSYKKDAQGLCSRLSGFVQCTESLLSRLKQNYQCNLNGPIQNLNRLKSVFEFKGPGFPGKATNISTNGGHGDMEYRR